MTVQNSSSFLQGYLKPVVFRVGLPLFLWSLFTQFADQYLVDATQNELVSESGAGFKLWFFGGLSMLSSIIGPVFSMIMIFFAVKGAKTVTLLQYFAQNLSWLFKEQLRAAGQMILWGMLFILPGFWKFFEFVMLPFVVCLEPRYQRGEVDALQFSAKVFRRIWWKLLLLLGGFFSIGLTLTSIDEFRSFSDHPISATGLVFVDLVIFVVFQWVLLRLWEKNAHI